MEQFNNANIRFDGIDQAQLDVEIKNGSAKSLARSLHHQLLVRPLQSNKQLYFQKLNKTRTLQAMVLCNVIDRLVRRSYLSIWEFGQQFADDLSASVPRVVKILAVEQGYSTIRFVTICSCIRIMRRIATMSSKSIFQFADSLLFLFRGMTLPSDILIDAACAIASFVVLDKSGLLIDKVDENSGALLSLLGAAASTDSLRGVALAALSKLGHIPSIGSLMSRRRGLVRAVSKHLLDDSVFIRKKSVALLRLLIANYGEKNGTPLLFECNLSLISRSMTNSALKEGNQKLQMSMIRGMSELIQKSDLALKYRSHIMETFMEIAVSCGISEERCAMESSLAYLRAANEAPRSVGLLSNVIHFTTSPFAEVRATALLFLKDLTFWKPDSATQALSSTNMLQTFSLIIAHGSDSDCCLVTEICKQIVFDAQNHEALCSNSDILASMVCMVTTEPVRNRAAFTIIVDILLELMAKSQIDHFLQFSNVLLPRLVKLANRTSDDFTKERLVSTIVRYSSAILK